MRAIRKAMILFAALLLFCAALPTASVNAAQINRFDILDAANLNPATYLIAGMQYSYSFDSDKASSTKVEKLRFSYSTDEGATWVDPPLVPVSYAGIFDVLSFVIPIDPQLTSARFRISAYFNPLIGTRTFSGKTIGPYKILQPGEPSDFTATPNEDGTVKLNWTDNSNMESYYRITRYGPDGTKTFDVYDTMETIGPQTYVDKQTNREQSTIYAYSLTPVIDKYPLPDRLKPGNANVLVKTKVKTALKVDLKSIILNSNLPKLKLNIEDIDKTSVSGVKLDKKTITLSPGKSEKLSATVMPANAANQKVTWSSDNSQVADVDASGNVTGKAPGFAKITVTTENGGFSDVSMATVVPEPAPAFPDIAGHPARAEIEKAVTLGIVSGYPDGTFVPDGKVTRAEFAKMITTALKAEGEGAPLAFADKDTISEWAIQPIRLAVKLGIIFGYDDNTFRPNSNITHSEMIAMVMRASKLPDGKLQPTGFADDASIPNWVRPFITKAEETGILAAGEWPQGKFGPQAVSTRAESVSSIVRMLSKIGPI